ncbi:DUF418 domain-containing protein [Brachybacterium sp. EF45031]|nr:DUF418 domain-containing protein [Brachybacterium sillae]
MVGALASIPLIVLQLQSPETAGFSPISAGAGLAMAATYLGITALLMHTPLRAALVAVFAPLGRTALTSYVTVTLVALGVATLWFRPISWLPRTEYVQLTDVGMAAV